MQETALTATARKQLLEDVLLAYLLANHAFPWPGADGLTLAEALDSYRQALPSRRVPNRLELLRRHPDLSDEIMAFFRGAEAVSTTGVTEE
jgi:hypothetical protein